MLRRLVTICSLLAVISIILSGCADFFSSGTSSNAQTASQAPVATSTVVQTSAGQVAAPSPTTKAVVASPTAQVAVPSPTTPPPTATPVPYTPTVVQPTRTPAPPTPTVVKPTATPTTPPATATPVNTPTPAMPYSFQNITWLPNCAMIRIMIEVRDASGNPVNGVVFRYETADGQHTARSNPTGQPGVYDPGWTDFTVSPVNMIAYTWRVWAVDGSDNPLSPKVDVTTDTNDCTGTGHQIAMVHFKKN